jgi:hypothetical protein
MRTAIFLVFLALTSIADAINTLAGKTIEPIPENVLTFLVVLFLMFIAMDIIEFFKRLSK